MIKYLVLIMILGGVSQAQKSFYAGRKPWYPKVLDKYTSSTTTTTTTTTTTAPKSEEGLVNRVGDNTVSELDVQTTENELDTDLEYEKFLKRVASWPVDKQPFWFKNRQAISSMINQKVDAGNPQPSPGSIRSPFAGRTSQ